MSGNRRRRRWELLLLRFLFRCLSHASKQITCLLYLLFRRFRRGPIRLFGVLHRHISGTVVFPFGKSVDKDRANVGEHLQGFYTEKEKRQPVKRWTQMSPALGS